MAFHQAQAIETERDEHDQALGLDNEPNVEQNSVEYAELDIRTDKDVAVSDEVQVRDTRTVSVLDAAHQLQRQQTQSSLHHETNQSHVHLHHVAHHKVEHHHVQHLPHASSIDEDGVIHAKQGHTFLIRMGEGLEQTFDDAHQAGRAFAKADKHVGLQALWIQNDEQGYKERVLGLLKADGQEASRQIQTEPEESVRRSIFNDEKAFVAADADKQIKKEFEAGFKAGVMERWREDLKQADLVTIVDYYKEDPQKRPVSAFFDDRLKESALLSKRLDEPQSKQIWNDSIREARLAQQAGTVAPMSTQTLSENTSAATIDAPVAEQEPAQQHSTSKESSQEAVQEDVLQEQALTKGENEAAVITQQTNEAVKTKPESLSATDKADRFAQMVHHMTLDEQARQKEIRQLNEQAAAITRQFLLAERIPAHIALNIEGPPKPESIRKAQLEAEKPSSEPSLHQASQATANSSSAKVSAKHHNAYADKTFVAVPYKEKDEARKLGVKWDDGASCWYLPTNMDAAKREQALKRWDMNKDGQQASQTNLQQLEQNFKNFLYDHGCDLSRPAVGGGMHPIMDGQKHRIAMDGNKSGKTTGMYQFFAQGYRGTPVGSLHDFKTGQTFNWSTSSQQKLTRDERETLKAQAAARKAQKVIDIHSQYEKTALQARYKMAQLEPMSVAKVNTIYLEQKQLDPTKSLMTDPQTRTNTYIPFMDINHKVWGLQHIDAQGNKLFPKQSKTKECFHVVGGFEALEKSPVILLAEGYATAATISKASGQPAVATFFADNLKPVAEQMQKRFPDKAIFVFADDDRKTEIAKGFNPGVDKAQKAAEAVGGKAVLPVFAPSDQTKLDSGDISDFNDMHCKSELGLDGVKRQVNGAIQETVKAHEHRLHAERMKKMELAKQQQEIKKQQAQQPAKVQILAKADKPAKSLSRKR